MRILNTALFILLFYRISCQNNLRITIETCEETFLKNNLMLLAEQYNIDAKKALTTQARLFPNPVVNMDINVYDPQNKKVLHIDSGGQKSFQVEQLIQVGGKRKNEIEIAKTNREAAEAEYSDLMRSLRLELHRNFYTINSQLYIIENYDRQLTILDTIISSYKRQTDKGNLPLKDLIRLKAVYIKINSDRSRMFFELNEAQKRLQLLLHTKQPVTPIVAGGDFEKFTIQKNIAELQTIALENNPSVKLAKLQCNQARLLLEREKKKNIPDVSLNASYDQRGGAFRNQVNMGITMPLPILNTNKGNIRAAEFERKASFLYADEQKMQLELEVFQAWSNLERSALEFKKVKELYNNEFSEVFKGINDNFHLRNITILEFVDFIESYNESLSEFEKVKMKLAESAATINYITASNTF